MTMKRWDGASQIDLTVAKRWDGANWIDLTIARRWDGANWIDIPLPGGGGGGLSATVSDGSVFGTEIRNGPGQPAVLAVGSDSPGNVTVTPTGGTAPYTYAWSHVSGDSAVQVLSPSAATTAFIANVGKNQTKAATKRCTVTDAALATTTVDVLVSLSYIFEF